MTANELADINEWSCCAYSKEVSAMLRQQQAEIEALKKELDEQIKNTHELLGWKWKDGDYDTQLKKASEK